MKRRDFLRLAAISGVAAFTVPALGHERESESLRVRRVKRFELDELGIVQLQELVDRGKASSLSLTKKYLSRIDAIDRHGPRLNAVIELNPDALGIAAELDKE